MAKVTYIGEAHAVGFQGVSFVPNQPEEVIEADKLAAFRGNRFFKVDGEDSAELPAGAGPKSAVVTAIVTQEPTIPTGETAPEVPPVPETDDSDVIAKHRGAGSYSVMRGDEEILEKLTKADAEAFNDMSVDEQDEYIASELAKKS